MVAGRVIPFIPYKERGGFPLRWFLIGYLVLCFTEIIWEQDAFASPYINFLNIFKCQFAV
jgi:hypothetical protein